MEQYLKSSTLIGSYGFISNLITIEKYGSDKKDEIERIINLPLFNADYKNKYKHFEVELLALIYHEITHFLDFTITTWGAEYQFRKSYFIKTKLDEQLNVFRLNYIELTMDDTHKTIFNKETNLLQNVMQHTLLYDEDIGGMILMVFSAKEEINLISSVNMKCLIESHAYITEILVKLRCIECEPDESERKILLLQIEEEFNLFLSNPEFIEYNMLIVLAKKHFIELSLKELAIFLNILFLRVLDFGMETLSGLANLLDSTYINKKIGAHISQEIRRGHCRHIIAFKLILLIFEYVKENEEAMMKLKKEPLILINDFLDNFNISYFESKEIHEFFRTSILFEEKGINVFDTKILLDSVLKNRSEYETLYQMRNISDICLTDIFLNDSHIVTVPNRIDVDI